MDAKKETQRIEAFSDGVYAIAITLLVLDLKPAIDKALPEPAAHNSLFGAMLLQWPLLAAFVTSFATIGIMWLNHHRLFNIITRSDHLLVILNLLLLFAVTVVPFPTALLGEHYNSSELFREATLIYSGTFLLAAIAYNVLWRYATHGGRLLDKNVDMQAVKRIDRQYLAGPLFYLVALILAWFSPPVSLGLNALLAAFFLLPGIDLTKRDRRRSTPEEVLQEVVE
jgi:uncharacterized membrane protein